VARSPPRGRRRVPHRTRPRAQPPRVRDPTGYGPWGAVLRDRGRRYRAVGSLVEPAPPGPGRDPRTTRGSGVSAPGDPCRGRTG
jgi:hypothetical protein